MHDGGLLRNPTLGLGDALVGASSTRHARAERRAMIALVAVFTLLVQTLMPAFAAAGPMPDGGGVICTTMGLQTAPSDSGPPAADHSCKHCVCPAPASEPSTTALVARVAYVEGPALVAPIPRGLVPQARAPPRPPGQGPPLPNA